MPQASLGTEISYALGHEGHSKVMDADVSVFP
jgi:hypothetical protein